MNNFRFNQRFLLRFYLFAIAIFSTSPLMAVEPKTLTPISQKADIYPGVETRYIASLQDTPVALRVIVNSNQDSIQPDNDLTLREAIALTNGTLPLSQLTATEKNQVYELSDAQSSRIEFNLPSEKTTIELLTELPPLANRGLIVDGTTQPGYDTTQISKANIITPVVSITTADNAEVFRGLTIIADGVTVRGLSLYSFTAKHRYTEVTPPADIFISDRWLPADTKKETATANFPLKIQDTPPKNVLIENNSLGVPPAGNIPKNRSAFGVSVFNSLGTTITKNLIANHDGSAIITGIKSENLEIINNVIAGNGVAGMPDAIRLEGIITNSQINNNLICQNDGSAVFLFKPQGSVQIKNNQITFNGRRFRRAAIYLMGSQHQVIDNNINNQNGAGVVVTSYNRSDRNIIQGNHFSNLEGLSIDLNTQLNNEVEDFQTGDGHNPPRNSSNRRLETGNAAINAPKFLSNEFFVINSKVNLDGVADPNSEIEIYQVWENTDLYGPLNKPLVKVKTDEKGKFSVSLTNLQPGDKVSAIATDPEYGTSEPAENAIVRSLDGKASSTNSINGKYMPPCFGQPRLTKVNSKLEQLGG